MMEPWRDIFQKTKKYPDGWSTTPYNGVYAQRAAAYEQKGGNKLAERVHEMHRNRVEWDRIGFVDLIDRERNYGFDAVRNALDLPSHLFWAAEETIAQVQNSDTSCLYHGTRLSRLSGILMSRGLRAFRESETYDPAVFGCACAIEAAHHAYTRGPEDTKNDSFDSKIDPNDPVIILKIGLEKLGLSLQQKHEMTKYIEGYLDALKTGERWRTQIMAGFKMGKHVPLQAMEFLSLSSGGGIASTPVVELISTFIAPTRTINDATRSKVGCPAHTL